MSDALLDAVRALRVAEPDLGFRALLAKLREQQPDLGAVTKAVREALLTLKAESEVTKAAAAGPHVAYAPTTASGGVVTSAAELGATFPDDVRAFRKAVLLDHVRPLRVADPGLGFEPLLDKLASSSAFTSSDYGGLLLLQFRPDTDLADNAAIAHASASLAESHIMEEVFRGEVREALIALDAEMPLLRLQRRAALLVLMAESGFAAATAPPAAEAPPTTGEGAPTAADEALDEAVRALRVDDPDLGLKPLLLKLYSSSSFARDYRKAALVVQIHDLATAPGLTESAFTEEVREALSALSAEILPCEVLPRLSAAAAAIKKGSPVRLALLVLLGAAYKGKEVREVLTALKGREGLTALTAESEARAAVAAPPSAPSARGRSADWSSADQENLEHLRACRATGQELVFSEELSAKEISQMNRLIDAVAAAGHLPPAQSGTPDVAVNLACFGCARLPSDMSDGRAKHPVCPKCRKLKVPTTYWCCEKCPGNPGAWKLHAVYHKEVKGRRKRQEDGGWSSSVGDQRERETAESLALSATQTGDEWDELMAEGAQYGCDMDWRRAAKAFREAIVLKPNQPTAYVNLANMLSNSGHQVEAAQRYLEAKVRCPVGSAGWAYATAGAFEELSQDDCWDEAAKVEWYNDEELKALSARVVKAAPDDRHTVGMRALVLYGSPPNEVGWWSSGNMIGPRSAAELKEAAAHFKRATALCDIPPLNAMFSKMAAECHSWAEAL